ncbi:MAG TPA: hypothetical protein VGK90_09935, partial [Rhizomicrobium sp.]
MDNVVLRHGETADVPALLEIYNYYIANTHITFDVERRSIEEHLAWFEIFRAGSRYQCFVAVSGGVPIGWASSTPF